jgi:hypothetical protein
LAYVGAAHVWQEHVKQDQVDAARLRLGEHVERLLAPVGVHDAMAELPKQVVEELGYPAVVVDDEEGGG